MYLIRADGNAQIGAGHLMRCLTIADAMRRYADSREILFVCADGQSAKLAESRGYTTYVLGGEPRDMEAELSAWPRIPEIDQSTNVILVDSYFVTGRYLEAIREYGTVALLDDTGEECFPVDRIINYNAFADRKQYERLYRDSDTELILGSSYVPVRPQFRERSYTVRERAEDILITTGGGDADNIAGRILKAMWDGEDETVRGKLHYHLIIGNFNPHLKEMKALEERSANIHIYHNVHDMAELMSRCDLAVTAGGSTVYELAVVGVPFICFSYAENQEKMTEYFQREEPALSAGAYHRDPETVLERIVELTMALVRDHEKRNRCCLNGRRLADGLGAERLAKLLTGS